MKNNVWLGPALKAARCRRNLSQEDLGAALGVTRNTVINWESERNKPDLDMLLRLCGVLHISVHDLFPDDAPLSRAEQTLIDNFRALKPETQELAQAMVFAMLEKEHAIRANQLRESFKVVPLEPGSLAAGTAGSGSRFVEDQAVPFFLRINDRTARADAVIRISGRSMEPVYRDGDYVYFQRAESAHPGEDVIAAWAGEQYVKRMDEAGKLFSVNPDCPFLYDGSGDDIRILGRVLGIVSSADRAGSEDLPLLEDLFHDELSAFETAGS